MISSTSASSSRTNSANLSQVSRKAKARLRWVKSGRFLAGTPRQIGQRQELLALAPLTTNCRSCSGQTNKARRRFGSDLRPSLGLRPDLATSSANRFCAECQRSSGTIRKSSNWPDLSGSSRDLPLGVILVAGPLRFGNAVHPTAFIDSQRQVPANEGVWLAPAVSHLLGAGEFGSSLSRRAILFSDSLSSANQRKIRSIQGPVSGSIMIRRRGSFRFVNSPGTTSPV